VSPFHGFGPNLSQVALEIKLLTNAPKRSIRVTFRRGGRGKGQSESPNAVVRVNSVLLSKTKVAGKGTEKEKIPGQRLLFEDLDNNKT